MNKKNNNSIDNFNSNETIFKRYILNNKIYSIIAFSTIIWVSNYNEEIKNNIWYFSDKINSIIEKFQVSDDNIKLYSFIPLSWWAELYWKEALNVYKMYIDNVNNSWWINWKKIELQLIDSKCGMITHSYISNLLEEVNPQVILWDICSGTNIPLWYETESKHIPLISSIASSPVISEIWSHVKKFFNDKAYWLKLAEFINKNWYTNIAILSEDNDYRNEYLKSFKSNYSWNIIIDEHFNEDEKTFYQTVKSIKDKIDKIDFLIFLGKPDDNYIWKVNILAKEWILEKLKSRVFVADLFINNEWVEKLRNNNLDWLYTIELPGLLNFSELAYDFIKKYESLYWKVSNPLAVILEAESISLVLDSINEVWYDSENIHNYLSSITKDKKRNWLIWEYYFDWSDAIWFDLIIKKYVDWKLVVVNNI